MPCTVYWTKTQYDMRSKRDIVQRRAKLHFLIPSIPLAQPVLFLSGHSQSMQTALSPLIRTLSNPWHSYQHKNIKLCLCFAEARFWKESLKTEQMRQKGCVADVCCRGKEQNDLPQRHFCCSRRQPGEVVFTVSAYAFFCLTAAFLGFSMYVPNDISVIERCSMILTAACSVTKEPQDRSCRCRQGCGTHLFTLAIYTWFTFDPAPMWIGQTFRKHRKYDINTPRLFPQ